MTQLFQVLESQGELFLVLVSVTHITLHCFAEINLLWAGHQAHHSSEYYNLFTALRQSLLQKYTSWIFYLPMALFIPPSVYAVHIQFNLLYQFWIHTESSRTLIKNSQLKCQMSFEISPAAGENQATSDSGEDPIEQIGPENECSKITSPIVRLNTIQHLPVCLYLDHWNVTILFKPSHIIKYKSCNMSSSYVVRYPSGTRNRMHFLLFGLEVAVLNVKLYDTSVKVINNLGPLEFILNTPSHHRVHHGRNPYCIDKNYGGTLIIWDRMFGTFVAEKDKIKYGLTHPINTFEPFKIQVFHHLIYIWKTFWNTPGFFNKVSVVFKGPGWGPGKPRLGLLEDIPEITGKEVPFRNKLPNYLSVYTVIHFILMAGFYIDLFASKSVSSPNDQSEVKSVEKSSKVKTLSQVTLLMRIGYIILTLTSIGFLMEQR
ncbi:Alkylglycerol monooxygenase [Varanus komodoensis]|nr:Alkylglycerol monooxygenase [Varanus komodoensis]